MMRASLDVAALAAIVLATAACQGRTRLPCARHDDCPSRTSCVYGECTHPRVEALYELSELARQAEILYAEPAAVGTPRDFMQVQTPIYAPRLGECCETSTGRCEAARAGTESMEWQWLGHRGERQAGYFSYEYQSGGYDAHAWFTVRAYGDLDCDGVYSTYEVTGRIAPNGVPEVTEP